MENMSPLLQKHIRSNGLMAYWKKERTAIGKNVKGAIMLS